MTVAVVIAIETTENLAQKQVQGLERMASV